MADFREGDLVVVRDEHRHHPEAPAGPMRVKSVTRLGDVDCVVEGDDGSRVRRYLPTWLRLVGKSEDFSGDEVILPGATVALKTTGLRMEVQQLLPDGRLKCSWTEKKAHFTKRYSISLPREKVQPVRVSGKTRFQSGDKVVLRPNPQRGIKSSTRMRVIYVHTDGRVRCVWTVHGQEFSCSYHPDLLQKAPENKFEVGDTVVHEHAAPDDPPMTVNLLLTSGLVECHWERNGKKHACTYHPDLLRKVPAREFEPGDIVQSRSLRYVVTGWVGNLVVCGPASRQAKFAPATLTLVHKKPKPGSKVTWVKDGVNPRRVFVVKSIDILYNMADCENQGVVSRIPLVEMNPYEEKASCEEKWGWCQYCESDMPFHQEHLGGHANYASQWECSECGYVSDWPEEADEGTVESKLRERIRELEGEVEELEGYTSVASFKALQELKGEVFKACKDASISGVTDPKKAVRLLSDRCRNGWVNYNDVNDARLRAEEQLAFAMKANEELVEKIRKAGI